MTKNPFNQRNPWLIKDLRAYKSLYNCRETFTDVMSALQIRLFMQNKAKFQKGKLNVNKVLTKDYEKRTLGERGKNKPNSNPIKANTKPIKANKSQYYAKTKPIQTQTNPISEQIYATAYDDYRPTWAVWLLRRPK